MRDDTGRSGGAVQEKQRQDGGGSLVGHTTERPRSGNSVASAAHKSESLACVEPRHRPEPFGSGGSSATWVPSDSCDETSSGGSGSGNQDAPVDCDLGSLRLRSLLRVANRGCSASSSGSSCSSSSSDDGEDDDDGDEKGEGDREEVGREEKLQARKALVVGATTAGNAGGGVQEVSEGGIGDGGKDDGKDEEGAAELAAALKAVLLSSPKALAKDSRGRGGRQQGPLLSSLLSPSNESEGPSSRSGVDAGGEAGDGGVHKEEGDEEDGAAAAAAVRAALAWSFPANRLSCVMEESGGCTTDDGESERTTTQSAKSRDKAAARSQSKEKEKEKEKPAWPNRGSARTTGSGTSGGRRPITKSGTACHGRRRKSREDYASEASVVADPPAATVALADGNRVRAFGSDAESCCKAVADDDGVEDGSVRGGIGDVGDVGERGAEAGGCVPAAGVVAEGGGENAQHFEARQSCGRRDLPTSDPDACEEDLAAASGDTAEPSTKAATSAGGDEGVSGTVWSTISDRPGGSESGADGVQVRHNNNLRSLRLWNSFTSGSSSSAPSDPQSHHCRRPWGSMNLGEHSGDEGPSGTASSLERDKFIRGVFGPKQARAAAAGAAAGVGPTAGSGKHDSSAAFYAALGRIASLPQAELSLLAELDRSSDEEEEEGGDNGGGGGGSVVAEDFRGDKHGGHFEERGKDSDSIASPGTSSSSCPLPASTTSSPAGEKGGTSRLVRVGSTDGGTGDGDSDGTTPYRYRRLAGCGRGWPPRVDPASREAWLCPVEFEAVFRMTYAEFKGLPSWKRVILKQEVHLF